MYRIPVVKRTLILKNYWSRSKSSSKFIRDTFIEYFVESYGHKHVKSSSVVPLCDPTVPFVNAGMNQFKGVFLGTVDAPHPKVVNSQKCVRVGGKHNDLDVVGTDGHHHTFFEMLGNWSFGDYYKKEACQMAWELLLGPYRLKPENLVVTYFAGDASLGLLEDHECKDIWRQIGIPASRLRACPAADNFWEMGATGPCGPCTEIHYLNPDGSLTEIWNLVFIQFNREPNGTVSQLRRQHVDTGMGLERISTILQRVNSNYDTDLFIPIIRGIEKNTKGVTPYSGRYGKDASLDCAYRRLADHARMISVCLADGVFPATSVNLKQIMRKSFKISSDVFNNPNLMIHLYDIVADTLSETYPELSTKMADSKVIINHEQEAYRKMKGSLDKRWKELLKKYPEVEKMGDVETPGFALGYREFKEKMSKGQTVIPGDVVFKLYDTHGFQQDLIEKIADVNKMTVDKEGFEAFLSKHKSRHKTAFKEQSTDRGIKFDQVIETLIKNGENYTNDMNKYNNLVKDNEIYFKPSKSKLVAILNKDIEWIDKLKEIGNESYYLVTRETNFYCEEGGQEADNGIIRINEDVQFNVDNVFKIRRFVFHKGTFSGRTASVIKCNSDVILEINSEKRLQLMRNHTAVHLLNSAIRKVLPNSVVCQIGSNVSEKGLMLNLSVYGEKLSQKVVKDAQELVRNAIKANVPLKTRVLDAVELTSETDVLTVPGETYPETGLRLVETSNTLVSKELCCGTHVPSTGFVNEFCVTTVKGAGGHTPALHALTGSRAQQARELFAYVQKLNEVDFVIPEGKSQQVSEIKEKLTELCGTSGAPYGEYADCLAILSKVPKHEDNVTDEAIQAMAAAEMAEWARASRRQGRRFVVQFLRCSYLSPTPLPARALAPHAGPALVLGCAQGVITAACTVPQELVTEAFTATTWLRCILPVFDAGLQPVVPNNHTPDTFAEMTPSKVSLINCDQLVQDAMRVAIKFAQCHLKDSSKTKEQQDPEHSQDRQHN